MSTRSNNSSMEHLSNTMEEEYRNSRYDDFQPGSRVEEKQQFRIIIRNFSEHLTTDGIRNLCSNYGTVLDVHRTKSAHATAFINFSTSVEAEAAVRGINEQPGRIVADFAKEKAKEANPFYIKKDPEEMNGHAIEYDTCRKIDMNARKIKGPFSGPYKHNVKKPEHFVTEEDYNGSALSAVDPQREFLVQSDAYEKERYLSQHNSHRTPEVNHLNRTHLGGRSLFVENVDVVEKARNMSINSNGGYNKSNDSFDYNSTFLEDFYSGSCIKCSRKAIGTCEVCGVFYCSVTCQHNDWPTHRIGCGVPRLLLKNKLPGSISFSGKGNLSIKSDSSRTSTTKPHQESPVQQKEKITENPILFQQVEVDGSCPVIITAVIDERTVFVRPTSHDSEYLKAIEDISECSRKAVNLSILPKKGDIVLSKFEGVYYRALVLNTVNKFSVRVGYLEYGNIEIKNLVDLKKLVPELQGIPRFVKKLFLKDISLDVKSEKVIDYLSKQMNNLIKLEMICEKGDTNEVELIDELTKESINKIIIDLVTIRPPALYGNYSNFTEMGVPVIPLGRDITVVITDNSQIGLGILSAMNEVELLTLEKLDKQVQDYCNSNESTGYSPRKMEMCLAKFDEDQKWYRAYCVEGGIGDGFISVIFCDYGNMSMVKIEDIKKFPKDMLTPALAATCYIKDFPKNPENISKQTKTKLSELLECGLKQVAEITKDEIGEYIFYLPEVDQILADQ